MKKQVEIKWAIFLFAILITAFGLFTEFAIGESLNINVHDTYIVIQNLHLLILLGLTIILAYIVTFALKRLASLNKTLKITSAMITGLIGVGLAIVLIISLLVSPSILGTKIISYGFMVLVIGLMILFVFRTREIWRIK